MYSSGVNMSTIAQHKLSCLCFIEPFPLHYTSLTARRRTPEVIKMDRFRILSQTWFGCNFDTICSWTFLQIKHNLPWKNEFSGRSCCWEELKYSPQCWPVPQTLQIHLTTCWMQWFRPDPCRPHSATCRNTTPFHMEQFWTYEDLLPRGPDIGHTSPDAQSADCLLVCLRSSRPSEGLAGF